jgi:hypothetical protein
MQAMLQNELQDENLGGNAHAEASFQLVAPGSSSRGSTPPVSLTNDLDGALWHGSIFIGTPAVMYTGEYRLFRMSSGIIKADKLADIQLTLIQAAAISSCLA